MSALHRYRNGDAGFYVVNRFTDLACSGPWDTSAEAAADIWARNARWPNHRHDDLEVVGVGRASLALVES